MIIRAIKMEDAERFLNLCHWLDQETQFMLLEPEERTTTVEGQRKSIEAILKSENQVIFVAEENNQLVGYISASGGRYQRERQTAYIVAGILQSFTGRGIGTQLFAELETWARQKHLRRLELTVMTHNKAAIALYQKRGFEIEGTRKQALSLNGQYIDEYYMAKLLDA